ncbi:aconitate hydratase [Fimicolochytrium jonesii]|uniref:aconitate hydratase n=1 Tax=Fimicolochytrium jonesii TaxID=1396493 RepID=UPI0022FE1F12|nr:aconitate hydratase [Fimicolochytrium jonesii]KAI8820104.1 aconitate hydratase [Fimicolochytrium jonesii]
MALTSAFRHRSLQRAVRCGKSSISSSLVHTQYGKRLLASVAPTQDGASTQHDPRLPSYSSLLSNLQSVRQRLNLTKPLTLSEKILYGHLNQSDAEKSDPIVRGSSYLKLSPDRVAMQDASAQMALLQFMLAKRATTAVPSSIHCDHLIEAFQGGDEDVKRSIITNKEIFDFLKSAAEKYGIAFWGPGSGIIHQIVLENYAAPGILMLGTDSHTPNAGGLGCLAIGVGGADAVDAMAGIPWELKAPKIMGVRLTGKLDGWTAPKDVILQLAGLLTVQGATNHIIEYFGPGTETLSCTGMATICNMGAEVGATTSTFPYSRSMADYLRATGRPHVADAAAKAAAAGFLKADAGAEYDRVIEIDLSKLEPHINGPFTPDAATPISQFKSLVVQQGWKDEIKVGLIGSCTNSSYEDMQRAAEVARQALASGVKNSKSALLITPGSEQIRATIERDGVDKTLTEVGGQVLANACGPCIGQWKRTDAKSTDGGVQTATSGKDGKREANAILTSFNRNFRSRNDGNPNTMNFIASPEIVTAMAIAGRLSFNPLTDSLPTPAGTSFKFAPPSNTDIHPLPPLGFAPGRAEYSPPPLQIRADPATQISIDSTSTRLQILEPFAPWDGKDLQDLRVLVKVVGKCTTDHISAAGAWLKYKGHLDNIANNTLIGATNAVAFPTDPTKSTVNLAYNTLTKTHDTIPAVARAYKQSQIPWCIIADSNYGEGSAREHAALQPRYLGCTLIIARSFARIHETNLKKQGVIPLVFKNPADYDKIAPAALGPCEVRVRTRGLDSLAKGDVDAPVEIGVRHRKVGEETWGKEVWVAVGHSFSGGQVRWVGAGSALNLIAQGQ